MASGDNPFASPSGDPPPVPPPPPDWSNAPYQQAPYQEPYQQGWGPFGEPQRKAGLVPRSLMAACHTAAVGAWVFVACTASIVALAHSVIGFFLLFSVGVLLALAALAALVAAVVGLVCAVPLAAVWWAERHRRPGDDLGETAALVHMVVAWAVAASVLAWILW